MGVVVVHLQTAVAFPHLARATKDEAFPLSMFPVLLQFLQRIFSFPPLRYLQDAWQIKHAVVYDTDSTMAAQRCGDLPASTTPALP